MLITVVRVARVLRADIPLVDIELTDGERRSIDLTPYLSGEIFELVRTDPAYFAQVRVDPEFRTLCGCFAGPQTPCLSPGTSMYFPFPVSRRYGAADGQYGRKDR